MDQNQIREALSHEILLSSISSMPMVRILVVKHGDEVIEETPYLIFNNEFWQLSLAIDFFRRYRSNLRETIRKNEPEFRSLAEKLIQGEISYQKSFKSNSVFVEFIKEIMESHQQEEKVFLEK